MALKKTLMEPEATHYQGHSSTAFQLPRVSFVVTFFGYPVLWLGSYNRDFGELKKELQ